jgi:hypothetical protein
MRYGRAGCPLYPGGDGVPRDHRDVRSRRLPPHSGWPLPPRYRTPTRDVRLTRHQQGFRVIHPSGLPLTCSPRSERAPPGFPLSFAPSRYQPRTPGRGRVWNTNPKSRPRHHAEPPINELTHNVRPRVAPSGSAADKTWAWMARSERRAHDAHAAYRASTPACYARLCAGCCLKRPRSATHAEPIRVQSGTSSCRSASRLNWMICNARSRSLAAVRERESWSRLRD